MSRKAAVKQDAQPTSMPKLRFPEFRDEPGWVEKKLHNCLTESRAIGNSGDIAKKLTVKLWGKGVFEKSEVIKGSVNTQYYQRRAGQFIYSKLDFLNQAFGIIPEYLDRFESTADLPCFDISQDLNANFLLEYVKRENFYKKLGEIADGGRKAKRIQAETFLSFPVALPGRIEEQQKIADCLASLDEVIAAQSQKLDALKIYKKGLMQQFFPGAGQTLPRLRFPKFQNAKAWTERKISEILTKISIPVTVEKEATYREIGVRSHGKGIFHKDPVIGAVIGEKRVFQVIEDALVLNIVFAWEQAVATTSKEESEMIASHRFPMYVPKSGDCDVRFVKHAFLTPHGKHLLGVASPGGAGRNRTLGQDEFEKLSIILPDKEEQTKIADSIRAVDDLITSQSAGLEALKTHKKGLMQQLFPFGGS